MIFDAIVLAGGRSSRLDGFDKTALEVGGRTLLDRAVDAAAGARRVIVVGSASGQDHVDEGADHGRYTVEREEPPFGGPAAAVGAAVHALASTSAGSVGDFVLVIAGDLPFARPAVDALVDSIDSMSSESDGVIAVDENGRRQYLTALYRTDVLSSRCAKVDLAGKSVRALVDGLTLLDVPVPAGSTRDVDTWADAEQVGATRKAIR